MTRQPPIQVPLRPSFVQSQQLLGAVGLQGIIPLRIDLGGGRCSAAIDFVVDSGAHFICVGIDRARVAGIPVPPDGSPEFTFRR